MHCTRNQYVISKALFFAIRQLKKEIEVFPKDLEAQADLADMVHLFNTLYDAYIPNEEWSKAR